MKLHRINKAFYLAGALTAAVLTPLTASAQSFGGWTPYNVDYKGLTIGAPAVQGVAANTVAADPIAAAQQIKADWDEFKANWIFADGAKDLNGNQIDGGLRVGFDGEFSSPNGNPDPQLRNQYTTVSEGMGYGMLLAVYMQDRATFDGLSKYVQAHLDDGSGADQQAVAAYKAAHPGQPADQVAVKKNDGLMGFKIDANGGYYRGFSGTKANQQEFGQAAATDADIDIAHAYLIAGKIWGDDGYAQLGKVMVSAIKANEIDTGGLTVVNGSVDPNSQPTFALLGSDTEADLIRAGQDTLNVNPSYFAPAAFRIFADATADGDFWNNVISANYAINQRGQGVSYDGNGNPTGPNGLVPQNIDLNGNPIGGQPYYQSDAFRSPFRETEDLLWNGDRGQGAIAKNNGNFYSQRYDRNYVFSTANLANNSNINLYDPNAYGDGSYEGGENVKAERNLDGSVRGDFHEARFNATAAATQLTRGELTSARDLYNSLASDHGVKSNDGRLRAGDYFDSAWRVFGELIVTGNLPDLYNHPDIYPR